MIYNEASYLLAYSIYILLVVQEYNILFQIVLFLHRVGNEIITVQDFIRRSEYAIRPNYCRQDNYIHKKIVLNSLIGEKLLSLEEKKNFINNEDINLEQYFTGRKEQSMRQLFYATEFHSNVVVDDQELKRI